MLARCSCGVSKAEIQEMGHTVETQLPIGSTEAQVSKFLYDRHIEHRTPSIVPEDPVPRYRQLRKIGATIENFWGSEPAMYVAFYFDKGKLVESRVSNACGFGCYSVRQNKSFETDNRDVFRDLCD